MSIPKTSDSGAAGSSQSRWSVFLDASKLQGSLTVRWPVKGEKFRPLGMKSGSKKVQKVLRSRNKDDSFSRYPVITTEHDSIVWYVGVEIADQYKVDSTTESTLELVAELLTTPEDDETDSNHD